MLRIEQFKAQIQLTEKAIFMQKAQEAEKALKIAASLMVDICDLSAERIEQTELLKVRIDALEKAFKGGY